MTLSENAKQGPACDSNMEKCPPADGRHVPLFERPWDEFVIKRDEKGNYRSFTQCCGDLTPV